MDPIANPYAPGAGVAPPELSGRDEIIERVRIAIGRSRIGNPCENIVITGLRGVGKTVLLDYLKAQAEVNGAFCLRVESPEHRSLPSIIAPELRKVLLKLSRLEAAKSLAHRGLRALASFSKVLKVTYQDIEVALDVEPESGLADNGNLESDIQDLLAATAEAAQAADTCICIMVDELQHVPKDQLGALIAAIHYTSQRNLPVVFVGSGFPQLRTLMDEAKAYTERLFTFCEIGSLDAIAAAKAILEPARRLGVEYSTDALGEIINITEGYPYFLQEWGKHSWNVASVTPITLRDVQTATKDAIAELDSSFFLVRFERLTMREKKYLRAMAGLEGRARTSGAIARQMGSKVQALSSTRKQLINKGVIWSPAYSENEFTAPLFDDFLRRIIPDGSASES